MAIPRDCAARACRSGGWADDAKEPFRNLPERAPVGKWNRRAALAKA